MEFQKTVSLLRLQNLTEVVLVRGECLRYLGSPLRSTINRNQHTRRENTQIDLLIRNSSQLIKIGPNIKLTIPLGRVCFAMNFQAFGCSIIEQFGNRMIREDGPYLFGWCTLLDQLHDLGQYVLCFKAGPFRLRVTAIIRHHRQCAASNVLSSCPNIAGSIAHRANFSSSVQTDCSADAPL